MKPRTASGIVATVIAALAAALWTAAAPGPAASAAALPGMCSGPTTPGLVVNAHANGRPGAVPKFILNVSTDASGTATGAMILGQGAGRLMVTSWCRVWQHDPAQQEGGKCGEPYPAGAITAHAVGLTQRAGSTLLVRADVRRLADGTMLFRVRYRTWTGEDTAGMTEGDSCEEEGWTRVPADGWDPLDQFHVASAG